MGAYGERVGGGGLRRLPRGGRNRECIRDGNRRERWALQFEDAISSPLGCFPEEVVQGK